METMTREKYSHLVYADNRTFTAENEMIGDFVAPYRYYFPDGFDFSIDYKKVKEDFHPYRLNHMLKRSVIDFMDYNIFNTWIIQPELIRCVIGELWVSPKDAKESIHPKFYNCAINLLRLDGDTINNKINFCSSFAGCTIEAVCTSNNDNEEKNRICATDLREMFYEAQIDTCNLDKLLKFLCNPNHIIEKIQLSHMFERAAIEITDTDFDGNQIDINLNHFFEGRIYPYHTELNGLSKLFRHTRFRFYEYHKPFNIFLDALKFDRNILEKYREEVLRNFKDSFNIIIDKPSFEANPVVRFHVDSSWPMEVLLAAVGDNRSPEKISFYKTDNKTIIEITN